MLGAGPMQRYPVPPPPSAEEVGRRLVASRLAQPGPMGPAAPLGGVHALGGALPGDLRQRVAQGIMAPR